MLPILSLFDALLTLHILEIGGTEENPFMAYLLEIDPLLMVIVKMGLTLTGYFVLKIFEYKKTLAVLTFCYFCLIVYEVGLIWLVTERI